MQVPVQANHEQLLFFVITGVLTVAVTICGYFLARLVSQMDDVVKTIKGLDKFMAQQEIRNLEVDKMREDLEGIYTRLNIMDEKRNKLMTEHNIYMKKHGIIMED